MNRLETKVTEAVGIPEMLFLVSMTTLTLGIKLDGVNYSSWSQAFA
jgi:hypothetical protein